MVKATLVNSEVGEGERLLARLDGEGIPVDAAFWLYSDEWDGYRLVIATPLVDEKGIRTAYERILSAFRSMDEPAAMDVSDLTVVSPEKKIVQGIRSAVQTKGRVSGLRLSKSTVSGEYVEDAYVYRA